MHLKIGTESLLDEANIGFKSLFVGAIRNQLLFEIINVVEGFLKADNAAAA